MSAPPAPRTSSPGPTRPSGPTRRPLQRWWSALAGVVAGLVLLGVSGLVSLLFSSSSAPLIAVGEAFVDQVPGALKDLVIGLFGTRDKLVLGICMLIVYAIITGLIGVLGSRRPVGAAIALGALGIFAVVMVLTRAQNSAADAVPTLVGTVVAVAALLLLLRAADPVPVDGTMGPSAAGPPRRVLILGTGVLAAIVAGGAQAVASSRDVARKAAQFVLPSPEHRAKRIPAAAQVDIAGMPPFLTPNADFYRIDTALAVPRVDPTSWELRVHGLVDQELTLSFEDLLAEPMVETHVTLTCVSNTVGGDLAGNATWLGVPVRRLLERAGVQEGADMVLSRSVDGFTASTPLEALTDGRDALIAVGMNGRPLPQEHGYPVRMVVPGLYGYVSATKWLTELTVTRFADDAAYWTSRGWSERGPIKTASRIDVPRASATLARDDDGTVVIGGTAWAQQRGIDAVEVQIDDRPWTRASLGARVSDDTWTQWSLRWEDAAPGRHTATVRAVDGDGTLQTSQHADPAPDGASGWHRVEFTVE
jgi:DMSO/TMAO reductase YedYZ molybdopterin-dependent catalytic subunit